MGKAVEEFHYKEMDMRELLPDVWRCEKDCADGSENNHEKAQQFIVALNRLAGEQDDPAP